MFGNFKEEARNVLMEARCEKNLLKHPYVGSEHLLLAILKTDSDISMKLREYNVTYDKFKEEILKTIGMGTEESSWFLYTPLLKRVIENAIIDSKEISNGVVTVQNLFSSLLEEGEGIGIRILISLNVDLDDLYSEFHTRFVEPPKRKKKLILDELGIDLTKKALEGKLDPVIGREEEIKRALEILCRRCKNNPILIGEAGVGKTAIVEELSRRISFGEVPATLKNKRIISISMSSFVAGTKYRGEFEERMSKVLKEVEERDDIILFIDEIHTLVGAGGAEGAIDASNILKPALARGSLHLIGATTIDEYKKYIEKDGALERRFQKVVINTPTKEETIDILKKLKPIYEEFHHVIVDDNIINFIVNMSEEYIYDRYEPDKSIDILDEVCSKVCLKQTKDMKKIDKMRFEYKTLEKSKNELLHKGQFAEATKIKMRQNQIMNDMNIFELKLYSKTKKKVTKKDIASVVSVKTQVPVYELLKENKKMVDSFRRKLKNNVVGQDDAINEIVKLYKKIKLGLTDFQCTSLLLVGPTGVGKTMLSKLFGEALVGIDTIKLDMSEYADASSISKIMGAAPGYVGYDDEKNILEKVRVKPHTVLILDELEKAHPSVINLFYQILEDASITDAKGNSVSFHHASIIMTSNVGFEDIHVGFTKKNKTDITSKLTEHFKTSFINRIDSIVVCDKLKKEDAIKLIRWKLNKLKKKYSNYHITISKKIEAELLDKMEYQKYGARRLDKLIKDEIEDKITDLVFDKKNIHLSSIKVRT